jgi:hypothetical protein
LKIIKRREKKQEKRREKNRRKEEKKNRRKEEKKNMEEIDAEFLAKAETKMREMCFQLNESMLEGNQEMVKRELLIQGRGAVVYKLEEFGSFIPDVSSIVKSYYIDIDTLLIFGVFNEEQRNLLTTYNPGEEYIVIGIVIDIKLPGSGNIGNVSHLDIVKFHSKEDMKDDEYGKAEKDIMGAFEDGDVYEEKINQQMSVEEKEEPSGITEIDDDE